ncbi:DUF192 domain-containing protein [Candidatus Amesbacteria bacterium]|nr:DUF192 domain-containing protein [Candidatus Amesbacteria bacterium]
MKKIWLLIFVPTILLIPDSLFAFYDPLSVPNNKYGVHILEPGEITAAAKLVNSSGGDWGYVTVPLRSDDRDREKWHKFFTLAGKLHIIPLVRLATYPDPAAAGWVKPNVYDLVDFANFLADMPWPTQNRYLIIFNEPNHAKEWGGGVDPVQYATLLLDAQDIFKSRSQDFFLLTAGLDMSAPTNRTSLDALEFYRQMSLQPAWKQAVDGFSVHAYPNPAFTAPVTSTTRYGLTSYRYELKLLNSPALPLFITETGSVSPGNFYPQAFTIFTDPQIVAVTPFILFAGAGEFTKFSLLNTPAYQAIQNLPKTTGSPLLNSTATSTPPFIKIGDVTIPVELANTPEKITQGLSNRSNLDSNSGMLFVFTNPTQSPFWMFHMNFPLDFIWIKDNKVVQLDQNIPPPSQTDPIPQIITPRQPIDGVLEVNAGFIKKHGIKVDDEVDISS